MLRKIALLFVLLSSISLSAEQSESKSVLLAILARNKAHVLPKFLSCIDALEYDKSAITIYVDTNNNDDETEEMLEAWQQKNRSLYKDILFKKHHVEGLPQTGPHDWGQHPERFSVLARIRNESLRKAQELQTDFYFVVDCDNFIIPQTLQVLVDKDKPIIAPMLKAIPKPNDPYTNFFAAVSENGYFKSHPEYGEILKRQKIGTFKVPLVHCTYLIKTEYLDRLSYIDGTSDYEFAIFSREARKNGVDQYICNEQDFGTLVHMPEEATMEEEKAAIAQWVSG